MKFKVISNYDTDLNIYNSVNNCFTNKTDIELTINEDYDYLLIINGYKSKLNFVERQQISIPREKIFGLLQEPIGNINYDRNLHFYCNKIYCQNLTMFNGYSGIVERPVYMFYSNHNDIKNDYFTNFNSFENRKKLCLIVSSIASPNNPSWSDHNYQKRHKLVKKLLESDLDFDFYGRGWNFINDNRYKGEFLNKHEILRNYEYSIAIENVCEKNYVTEKMFDCVLNNTIPLYYGCPNISDIFDPNSYELIDIDDENIIQNVKQIIKTSSSLYRQSILNSKQIYFEKFNLFNLMKEIENEKSH